MCFNVFLEPAFPFECFWAMWTLFGSIVEMRLTMFCQSMAEMKRFSTQIAQQIGFIVLKMESLLFVAKD